MTSDIKNLNDNIEKRRIQLNMTKQDLDTQSALEYECFVYHQVNVNKKDIKNFPLWEDLNDITKLFYRHRAVRDI